ncbi:hypothetical protein HDU86_001223 [Geranomyces michiganensis]|nr:hypothetical protein HDU86_001223 [Geranomyces michiganensis]
MDNFMAANPAYTMGAKLDRSFPTTASLYTKAPATQPTLEGTDLRGALPLCGPSAALTCQMRRNEGDSLTKSLGKVDLNWRDELATHAHIVHLAQRRATSWHSEADALAFFDSLAPVGFLAVDLGSRIWRCQPIFFPSKDTWWDLCAAEDEIAEEFSDETLSILDRDRYMHGHKICRTIAEVLKQPFGLPPSLIKNFRKVDLDWCDEVAPVITESDLFQEYKTLRSGDDTWCDVVANFADDHQPPQGEPLALHYAGITIRNSNLHAKEEAVDTEVTCQGQMAAAAEALNVLDSVRMYMIYEHELPVTPFSTRSTTQLDIGMAMNAAGEAVVTSSITDRIMSIIQIRDTMHEEDDDKMPNGIDVGIHLSWSKISSDQRAIGTNIRHFAGGRRRHTTSLRLKPSNLPVQVPTNVRFLWRTSTATIQSISTSSPEPGIEGQSVPLVPPARAFCANARYAEQDTKEDTEQDTEDTEEDAAKQDTQDAKEEDAAKQDTEDAKEEDAAKQDTEDAKEEKMPAPTASTPIATPLKKAADPLRALFEKAKKDAETRAADADVDALLIPAG